MMGGEAGRLQAVGPGQDRKVDEALAARTPGAAGTRMPSPNTSTLHHWQLVEKSLSGWTSAAAGKAILRRAQVGDPVVVPVSVGRTARPP
mmetsp:Transcript_18416/g.52592  ORF Transcript_18416/g.52592 Transcript_18416/m.52592 type:complete len:90 (+) Transcript_18416:1838-2107(+)